MNWKNNWIWLPVIILTLFLGWYVLFQAQIQQAGDIAEYYGVTESIVNHLGVKLTTEDRASLEEVLHPEYFDMPGYYLTGRGGSRYPVHFWFYSLLAVPFRLILSWLNINPIRSLFLVNLGSIVLAAGVIIKRYLRQPTRQLALLGTVFSSALMSFLVWPGPDLWYLSLLLVVPFAFFNQDYWLAAVLAALASWHSQPVIILAAGLTVYALMQTMALQKNSLLESVKNLEFKYVLLSAGIGLLALFPYSYNLLAFGVLTPWTKLRDGWTVMRGFGLHNASLWKFYEQWFDLNIGLFWYAPAVFILSVLSVVKDISEQRGKLFFFISLSLLTAVFYQTNPAWHYGTAGYGPGRHCVYLLPILIYFVIQLVKPKLWVLLLAVVIVFTQLRGLALNGYLEPDFTTTLDHSPYAKFVLDRAPGIYTPTPEIFIDRTNHTDLGFPTTAVYKVDGMCAQAYVLLSQKELLLDQCGWIPQQYAAKFDNSFERVANYERTIVTKEATYWPDPNACDPNFKPSQLQPYQCLHTREQFLSAADLTNERRLKTLPEHPYPGVWKVTWGEPVELTVPAGYSINYYSLDGVYVSYPLE